MSQSITIKGRTYTIGETWNRRDGAGPLTIEGFDVRFDKVNDILYDAANQGQAFNKEELEELYIDYTTIDGNGDEWAYPHELTRKIS